MNLLEQADKIDAALAILMKRENLFVDDKEFQDAKRNLQEAINSLKNYKVVNKGLNGMQPDGIFYKDGVPRWSTETSF